jgi:hypothetical protein
MIHHSFVLEDSRLGTYRFDRSYRVGWANQALWSYGKGQGSPLVNHNTLHLKHDLTLRLRSLAVRTLIS